FAFAAINGDEAKLDHMAEVSRIAATQVKPFLEFYRTAFTQFPECMHTILYEQLIDSPLSVLQGLTDWLELETSFDSDAVASIMNVNIVSARQRANRNELDILRKCASSVLEEEVDWYERLLDFDRIG